MTEQYPPADDQHVPDCDDYAFSGAGFHPTCERSCICRQVARVEHRMLDEALAQARAREVNGVTFAQAWALATNACIDAFYERISDSDLDDLLSDDEKDRIAQAIRSARQKGN
tara:strand:+ start:301 stop:639 length:339 start_codon:yes stop_codon:yes gene_type:complete